MEFTLGTAAKRLGLSKPTVAKHIAQGRLAAVKLETGVYAIDGAELARFEAGYRRQAAKAEEAPAPAAEPSGAVQLAVLENELRNLRDRLAEAVAREQKAEAEAEAARQAAAVALDREREAWQRVAGLLEGPRGEPRGWWSRIVGKKKNG